MKPSQRYAALLATASLIVAVPAFGQNSRPNTDTAAGAMKDAAGAVSRVTKDSVKHRFTAKDLIGAAVYDTAGEKIGDISDIDLSGAVPGTLASAFNMDQVADRADRDAQTTTPSTAAGSSSRLAAGADSALKHATVFLSIGGMLGIGDDLVSVPVSKLNYNSASDRFELAMAKADVVALAEAKDQQTYATDSSTPAATRAGKQSFADEATRVKSALAADPQTSAFAQKVTVMAAGESLEIRGIVDNKEQQKRIVDAARRATSLDIDDKIEVRD
jgi:osmotically-inducible protein OsmY